MEKFPKKSWRTKLALAVTAGILAAGYVPQTFAASYSGNNNTIWGMQSEDSKTFGSNMSVAADGSLVFDFGEAVTFENSNVASPKSLVKNGNVPGAVVIKSDFTGIMHSKDYSAMAIQAGWLEGNFDEAVDKRGSVTFDGNVTLRDKNVKGEWGVTSGDLHGGFLTYKGARWQPVGIRAGLCGDVIINGNLDMAVKGSALVTDPYYKALKTTGSKEYADDFKTSTITTNGDVNIDTPEDYTEAFYSIANYGGTINVNADATAARDKTVVIKGNVLTMRDGDGHGEPYFYRTGQTNIGLTNDKSSWTGVVDNTGIKQTGEVNLWLQNNAVWNHKSLSLTNGISLGELPALSAPQYDKYDGITHINKLSGGSSEANAGLIFQDNKANIDINNYSGHTTVFYKHDNDGSASADYTAGDVIIRNAEKDSAINMVTDSSKIDTKDSAKLNSVLNALAGKLTYADYANNPENLLGTVKIAGGLTNDSVTIKSGKIQFADNGKGSYSKPAATKFTTTLTGDADADEEYAKADIIQGDGSYKFANDSSITAVNGIDTAKDLKIDAAGKTLTVTTAGTDSAAIKIFNNGGSKLELTADKLVINSSADYAGKNAGIMAGDWNTTKKNVTVNGAVDITATNTVGNNNYVYGVLASNADVTVNGNLKADIDGGRGGYDHTSDSAVMAQGSSYRKTSSTVTVNGDVDITANGNGLHTNGNGSVITVNGGGAITVNDSSTKGGYAALRAGNGTINMNVALANGKATGGLGHDVAIKGNLAAIKAGDTTASVINVALDTDKSALEGVTYMTGGNGQINMWLQNGASWNNEVHGSTEKDWKGNSLFNGSQVTSFAGGATAAAAGNIYQKDSNALTIDNYSGNTNIFYEHTGDGVTFNAGDTIIKHAEKDSVVNLITSSKGLSINAETINDTLSALAGKLTYTNYKDGERNLDGKVKIAGGLTSDSLTVAAGDILFGSADGKGTGVTNLNVQAPDHQVATSFNSTLTGDTEADLEYVLGGAVKDGSYKFTENTTINVNGKDARGMDFADGTVVDASGKTLNINVTDGTRLNAGISQITNADSHVKANKIVIKLDSKDASGTTHAIHQDKGNLTIDGDVDIDITGQRHTVGVYSHAGSTTINGNVKVVLDGNHGGFAEYGAAGIYAHAGYGGAVGGTVNVNGNVDISGVGNGLFANIGGGTINVNGGKINIVDDNTDTGYSAIYSTCGAINMNTVKDEKGNVIGAGNNKVDITGNVVVSVGAVNYVDCYEYSLVNLGLTTKDSQLTGVIYNEFPEGGKTASQGGNKKLFTGAANLWLQNGATWTNEQQGTLANVYQGEKFTGSHVAKLTGGATAEAAGNIYQKESGALTIDNYSGNTNIFYEHTGDGVTFNAGDTIIKHAEKDSVVNLITSSKGLSINAETINDTLSALAGKLTYTNYKDGERNLDGKVKIAGGLTSDSLTVAAGDILFGSADGKGTGVTNLNVQAPDHQVATSFNSTLTGDTEADLEYVLGGAVKDGSYKFTENTTINVNGKDARGMDFADGTVVDASGKTLNINVTDGTRLNAGISQITNADSHVKANKIVIKLDSKDASGTTHAIHQDKGNLTIDGDVDIDITGQRHTVGVYSHAGSTTINGNVKVVLDGNHGGFAEYGAAGIYAHAGYGGAVGGTVNVNGNVDISGVGNGLFANIGGGTINVNGGKINIVDDNTDTGYSAIYSTCGAINMNTVKDEKGNVIGAGNNKVDITGNVVVSVGAVNYVDCYEYSLVNLGLTTKDSQLTGVIYNEFPEGGKTASQGGNKKLFTGAANLWLQNGATWTNEQQGTLANVYQGEKFTGSHVAKLTGGATAEAAGNIYQKESGALTIDNYSGNTNIFYEHAGDGVTFNAGDTVIKHAEKGSAVNLITSNKGLSINAETINDTLNALAGKLTYSNYAKGERNLDGKVKIAGGLTSDSVTMAVGDILFNEADGKGSGAQHITVPSAPENQVSTSFNTTLTGDKDKDLEYVLGGVIKDGSYKFTEATSINVSGEGAKGMNFVKGTAVDASGKTLTVNVTDASKGNAGIAQDIDVNSSVKADKLVIKLDSTKSGQGAQGIRQTKGNLTVDGNVDIDVKGDNSTMGVYSHAGSTTINGDVKVVLDGNRGGFGEYGAAGLYAHAGYGGAVGGTINVNGNVDISGVGNGLFANIGGATINVNGGKINIVDTDNVKKNGYSAIYAANGKINVNTVKDADGKVTGAGNNKVDITGNIVTSVGAVNYVDCSTETEVNVGLTTKDSQLTGVVYNQFPEGGKTVSQKGDSKTFTGATNLWLQNGATWTNEQQGVLPSVWGGEQFKGSRVNKLAGGATAEAAGNIYQNDSNSLTIDNYSGVPNIIYAHGGDGTSYAAGDTVIKHAEAGSVVNMITSNQGVTDISAALNALAGKLTYLNYATANGSERNLNGYVKLAGGLTSDSVTMVTGDIRFSEETGKGSGTDNIKFADEPDNQTAKTFNSTLTGERLKDLEYVMGGVVKDGTYKFTENTAINVSGEGAKGMNFVKDTAVDASGKTLSVNVTEASKGNAGISQDVDVNSTIKADKLVIKLDSEKSGKGAQAIRQDKGNLTIDANVDIDVKGDNSTMGIYSHAGSTTVNGDVKVVLDGKRGGFNEYGAAGIYAHAGYGGAVGGTVNVNGNVDISGVGNGLFANIGGATINVNGGKINIVDTDKKNGYSAIYATCGAINMNTVKDAAGKVIGAGNNKVDITGNVVVSVGAVNYVDCCTETEVNLGLTTKDSKLTGVVYNQFPEGGKTVSQRGDSKTFTGAANLWLQNGALWTNEQQGELPSVWGGEQFKGSFVTNLVGGTNADNAGQIYQKDSNNLTIDTLSGSIRVIYDHEFEDAETRAAGDKKIVYKAGNTVINNAKDGSQVIMATGSNGINTFDKDSVEDAFKGLANKLIYKDAEKNPGNLKAELQLGGGLTGSNVSWSGDIEWDGNNGSYKLDSAEQSIKLLYDEDAVSKDTRAAIMSGMVGWRNAATDTYRARAGAYGEDNQFPEGGKTVSQRGDSKTFTGAANLWLQNGALWTNEQQGELPSVWGGEQFKGSFVTNLVGGTNADNAGQIYQKDSNNLTIDTLSGSIRVIYDHEFEDAETRAAGDKKIVYKAGNTVINNAKDGSQVIMATGSNGINTFDKDSVEDAFKGLANKLIYKDAEKNPGNLKAELQLGGGLTGSNVSWSGDIEWDGNNGSYKLDSAEQSIKLLYDEDAVSKDTRAAIMSGMVGWRNAATDTYRARAGAYGEDNQGVWARTWGGQNKYTGNNTSFKNSYWAGQVGYDKTLANGWNVGVAFDYMTGDDSYYAGSGDTKTYTLGLYGSKEISNNEFIDLTAKVGRVSNDFETKDILGRTVKGDYKANGFSFSGQYSKRFGSEAAGYFEPQAQLTIGRLGSCDFDSTGTLEGHISQDAFTSIVGRLGIEAGQASEHGRYFARLSLSHEFAGDVDTHFSDSSASMTREFNLDGTWCDLTVGGTYDLSDKVSFYGDVTKTLTGDYKQDWKVNAGLRFTF